MQDRIVRYSDESKVFRPFGGRPGAKEAESARVKYWEIIADNLKKAGWSCGVYSDSINGRTIWIVDAHRGDGKGFFLRAGEKLTASSTRKNHPSCSKLRTDSVRPN